MATVLIVMANISNIPLILNLVSYLHGTMHMGVKDASTTSTNFFGAICFFSFLGAFISDSYIKRFYTILIFAPIEIMVSIHRVLDKLLVKTFEISTNILLGAEMYGLKT